MIKNIFRLLGLFIILISFTACPNLVFECFPIEYHVEIKDLGIIQPLQDTFHVGDEMNIILTIPSKIDSSGDFRQNIDIFTSTQIQTTGISNLEMDNLKVNSIEIVEGSMNSVNNILTPNLAYYPDENEYRFKAKIKFTQNGRYSLGYLDNFLIYFSKSNCDDEQCFVSTNFKGSPRNGSFEIVVLD